MRIFKPLIGEGCNKVKLKGLALTSRIDWNDCWYKNKDIKKEAGVGSQGVYMAFLLLHNYMDFILDATPITQ